MELRHIRYFLAVADARNFTRAAAALGIGQPPLSQQIKDLEAELEVQLFHRVPHGAELTPAGEAFLIEARETINAAERAVSEAKCAARGESGRLRIGFTSSAAFNVTVPTAIRNFGRAYPRVRLALDEANTQRLFADVTGGRLDAAFVRIGPEGMAPLRSRRFPDEAMVVALPASHPLSGLERIALKQIADDTLILFPRSVAPSFHDVITGACRAAGFEPIAGQEVPQQSSIINLVAAEAGVAIVPLSLAQVRIEGVHFVAIEGTAPTAHLSLIWRRDSLSVTLKNFLALIPREEDA
jgi:DNA-binding transcriptional LysR family regulator